MTAARSLPVSITLLVATVTLVGGCVFSSAIRLMSVENVNRLNNRKSQMTMRMLRFMTAKQALARPPGRSRRRLRRRLPLQAAISGAPGAYERF